MPDISIGLIVRAFFGIILIGIVVGGFNYFMANPLVFLVVLVAIGAGVFSFLRHRRNKNKV